MMMHFDDTPLPPVVKKTGTIMRVQGMWHEAFAGSDTTRFFGVIRIDGKDHVFRADCDDQNADLSMAQSGDTFEIGSSRFGDEVTYLRSARLLFNEDDDHFRAVLSHLTGTTQARGTVLRKSTFVRRSHSYTKEQCRIAILIETLAIKGVITVSTEDKAPLIAAQPGDEVLVAFEVSSYAPHGVYLKAAKLIKLAAE
jgi:hypothetical protein